ncbi:hypothetical protein HW115_13470 [Verrucomicrobiaceae bacterium N1E253]|uniref:Lipoprotein n=1 Tax=Oceaniferula marina TaxID=2748318 RepID=A0A851GGY2_9BACT|nr:hypothetical protein [Oceaniferula marina]NWK56626.1 hypothetical protein [Oceaniferula marina]
MSKIFFSLLAFVSLLFVSCADQSTSEFSPAGPQSDSNSMPHNRPMGPEGAGALGVMAGQQ